MSYDIIGDIHGHADALAALLADLGYKQRLGAWRHPHRQGIFVGDFIDRGPRQIESVDIVRRMVDAGSALAIMGNHEFNAIAWFLPDPERPGDFLRPHAAPGRGRRNYLQHKAFLDAVGGRALHEELIDWFLTLPLWLDLPRLRVVHACWHQRFMDYLAPHLTADGRLTAPLMVAASREPATEQDKDSPEPTIFKAVEALLKGIEIPLPPPHTFTDEDGQTRHRVRVRWWDAAALTYRQAALLPDRVRAGLPDQPIPASVRLGLDGDKPLFIGHYWLTGTPRPLTETLACVDYSIAGGGKLAAYRWDGEPVLDAAHFRWVSGRAG